MLTLADLVDLKKWMSVELSPGTAVAVRRISDLEAAEVRRFAKAPPIPLRRDPSRGSASESFVADENEPDYLRKLAEYEAQLFAGDFALATEYQTKDGLVWPGLGADKDASAKRTAYLAAAIQELREAVPRATLGMVYRIAHGIVTPPDPARKDGKDGKDGKDSGGGNDAGGETEALGN